MMDLQNPHVPTVGHISVTLKGEGKDATWIVFHGKPDYVRAQIMDVMGMDEHDGPLYDLINQATTLFKGASNVSAGLGGRVINGNNANKRVVGGPAWDEPQGEPAEPVDLNALRLSKAIEAATEAKALQELYARNKEAFVGNAELFAEWNAKGKSLSS